MTSLLVAATLVVLCTFPSGTEALGRDSGSSSKSGSIPYIRKEQLNQYIQEQSSRANHHPQQRQQQQPNYEQHLNWQSYSETIEFLPMMMDTDTATTSSTSSSTSTSNGPKKRTLEGEDNDDGLYTYDNPLEGLHEDDDTYKVQPFVTGYDEYDEYQQAWRMLGFIIDCHEQNLRSYDDDNNSHDNGDEDEGTGQGCYRYVMWAAYVDLDYQGGGIGEYQYWDRTKNKWDDSTCNYGSSNRCAKMDCHLTTTHWRLLGFFKHRYIDDWMEQLFKHEGVCVWSEEEYAFMKNARETWPQGCIATGTTSSREVDENGDAEYIYYDMKPVSGGGIKMGLYTDPACVVEYQPVDIDDPITVENLLGDFLLGDNDGGSGDNNNWGSYSYNTDDWTFEDSMNYWDTTMSAFQQCQPCVAYDITNYDGTKYSDDYYYGNGENDKDGNDAFDCYDDADYTNVNQCMKFMAKTEMLTATFRDLALAKTQGTINLPFAGATRNVNRSGYYRREAFGTFMTYVFLVLSILICIRGLVEFLRVKRDLNIVSYEDFKQPLAPIT